MCLAIYQPAGKEVQEKYLRYGFDNHSDGAGMAWAADGVLHVEKGIFNIEKLLELYEQIKQYPCLIHFRKATHGKIDKANCHPFLFNDGKYALIHNGVLNIKCSIEGLSDTAHWVKLVLEPLVKKYNVPINDGSLFYLVSQAINGDKMAIMDALGKTYIVNEDKGTWDEGVWYSNTSFRWSYKTTSAATTTTYQNATYPYNGRGYFVGGTAQGQSSSIASHNARTTATQYNHNDWRKKWDEPEEGDESYIEFWRRVGGSPASLATVQGCCEISNTQRATHLLEDSHDSVDEAGNVISVDEIPANQFSEGQMCEYGWFDPEIEADIAARMQNSGITREEALIRAFNEQ